MQAGTIAQLPFSDSSTATMPGRKLIMIGLDHRQGTIDQIRRAEVFLSCRLQTQKLGDCAPFSVYHGDLLVKSDGAIVKA